MKSRFSLCLLFIMSFFLHSCESENLETLDSGIKNASGEEIFRSVILQNGKYTQEIDFLTTWQSKTVDLEFENALLEYIHTNEPTYLAHLKKEFVSKDPQRIFQALRDTRDILNNFGKYKLSSTTSEIKSEEEYLIIYPPIYLVVLPGPPVMAYTSTEIEHNDLMAEQFALSIAQAF